MMQRWIATAVLACVAVPVSATVLTFDDLVGGPVFFTSNYQGFMFGTNSIVTTAWFYTVQTSPFYTPHSGSVYIATDFQLYSGSAYEATQPISNASPFRFDGAWFSGSDTVGYQLFNGTTLVSTSAPSAALNSTPQFVSSGYAGPVTQVVVFGHQGFYALDDFTFDAVAPTAVPEPESVALILGGLGVMAAFLRRRRRAD